MLGDSRKFGIAVVDQGLQGFALRICGALQFDNVVLLLDRRNPDFDLLEYRATDAELVTALGRLSQVSLGRQLV